MFPSRCQLRVRGGVAAAQAPAPSDGPIKTIERTSRSLLACEPLPQLRPPPPRPASLDRNGERLPLANEHDEAPTACYPSVDQVPLQHRVVLRRQRDDHGRVFRTLALVDRRRVGKYQLVELAKAIGDFTALEVDASS